MSEDASAPAPSQKKLVEMLPQSWQAKSGDALVSAYQMLGVSVRQLSPPITFESGNVCVLMAWLGIPQLSVTSEYQFDPDGQIKIGVRGGTGAPRPVTPTALFLTESERSDISKINAAEERIHEVVGLLSAVESLNLVFEHVEDYWLSLTSHELSPFPVLIYSPLWLTALNLDPSAQQRWSAAAALIAGSPDRDRINLSLRWFDDGKRAKGTDSFLKLWFALETLAMPNTTNIRPIREALASVYGIPVRNVEARFGVGKIFGLRADIVHTGLRPEISGKLLQLLAGVYMDVLCNKLGAASAYCAQSAIDDAGGLQSLLP